MKSKEFIGRLVQGSGGGKGGGAQEPAHIATEAPNTLQSKAVLRVVELVSEGEIEGLVDGAKSIFLDNTPLQNADGSYNFPGVTYYERLGTPDQDHIPGFSDVEEEFGVGTKVTTLNPIVRTITDADTDAVIVTVKVNALSEQDVTNGDLNGSSVSYSIAIQPNGDSYSTLVSDTITGKTMSPYERSHRINLPGSAPWNIKVTRITADNAAANIQNDIYFSRYTRVIDSKLIYPDSAVYGIAIDSSLFGSSIPTRSYDVEGIKLKIPTNYDPETRLYTGVWDGTFQTAYSNNPAWVLYALLTSERYGLGNYIDPDEIDKFGLYTIAQYCDGLVDDGNGNLEPRFTFNTVIETQAEALKVLQTVASVFQGMMYWGAAGDTGIVTVVSDMPKDPIKLFTQANVLDGMFTYTGSALTDRHSVVYVTWNDPDDAYATAIEAVEDADLIERYGFRVTNIVAYGCTSRSQAHRFGRWLLYTEAYETELVSFGVSLADADIRPGDVIKVQDKDYADARYGGRIVSATSSTVTLDSAITIESGQEYTIDVILPNGNLESRNITDTEGTYTTLNVADDFTTAPAVSTMWVITATDLSPRLFRVISLTENDAMTFSVSALVYYPGKFDLVENDIKLPDVNFTRLRSGQILAPTNLITQEYLYRNGVLAQSAVTLSWTASDDSRVTSYQVEAKKPGDGNNYELAAITSGVTVDIKPTFDGIWSFRVKALDIFGNFSTYLTLDTVYLTINSSTPPDVDGFDITPLGSNSELTWNVLNAVNLDHYEIRYNTSLTGATWNNSQVLLSNIPKDAGSITTLSRIGTFLIKAVTIATDTFPNGVYSQNATLISTAVNFFQEFNFVVDITEDPDFLGDRDNTIVVDGSLQLDITGNNMDEVDDFDVLDNVDLGMGTVVPEGTYTFYNSIDLGDVYTSRLSAVIDVAGNNLTNSVDGWDNVDNVVNVDGSDEGQWDIQLQVRHTNDDPGGTPTWTDWLNFSVGDYNARAFEFRIKLFSYFGTVTPAISALTVIIDMPDTIRSDDNLTCTAGGITVDFSTPFRGSSPAVVITGQNMQQGDYWVISNKLAASFDVEFFNASNVSVTRTFDYVAKGYGFVT